MPLIVQQQWPGRYDDRLTALPAGTWASVTDRALTIWREDEPGPAVVAQHAHPGPLTWLHRRRALAWGPDMIDLAAPVAHIDVDYVLQQALPELSADARRPYMLRFGVLGHDGSVAVAMVERRPPPVRAGREPAAHGPVNRLVALEAATFARHAHIADDLPTITAASWGDGPLILGTAAALVSVDTSEWTVMPQELPSHVAARALAVDGDGVVAAAMADGSIITWAPGAPPKEPWPAHTGPALSAAWSPSGLLATGGQDGALRVWSKAGVVADELADAAKPDGAVEAIAWISESRLVAKFGAQSGTVALLRWAH